MIKLSAEERASGKLNPETLENALHQVKMNGVVVFESVLPEELVDDMNANFLRVLNETLQTNAEATELNTTTMRKNRIRMDLPFYEPFSDPQVITNAFALPIIERLVGEDCRCFYLSVDAPMPGSDYQNAHGDYFPFFPESDIILPPTGIVVNFPLIDVTEENGPMEAWPGGTHHTPEKMFADWKNVVNAAEHMKPVRMTMPKGSMIIRDIRMWHRGTPNLSDEIRPNVALIYGRSWWDGAVYAQKSLNITRARYEQLSERAQRLFRFEKLIEEQPVGTK